MLDLSAAATSILKSLASDTYIKLVRITSTYNASEGTQTETQTEIALTAANLPVPDTLVDGTRILSTDNMVIIDGQTKPAMTDKIKFGGKQYNIVEIEEINHAGTPQAYKVVCRG